MWQLSGKWHEKFYHGLMQLLYADLHWLDVPERVKYKLRKMMH